MPRNYEKSIEPRKPVKVTREECLKCEKGPFETVDDIRICPGCTTSNLQNHSCLDDTRFIMGSQTGGRRKGRS